MKRLFTPRAAALVATAGTILALAAGVSPAQAFTCPGATVCLFTNTDYTGNYGPPWVGPAEIATQGHSGAWRSFGSVGISPNPGSASDNSGSAIYFDDKAQGGWTCAKGGSRTPLFSDYGYFYITFGVKNCASSPPGGRP